MDYEKKYKDLVEAVKELQEANPYDDGIQKWVRDNVPELKESEDEKIRMEIIEYIKTGTYHKKWVAWLEKQGNQDDDSNILQRFSFYSYKDEPNVLYLAGVFVNEECRNKGIGTKILKVADEVASSMRCRVIRLKTQKDTDAYKLYIKNGYSILTDEGNQVWLEKQGSTTNSIKWHDVSEKPEKNRELLCEWVGSNNCIRHDVTLYNPANKAFWNCGRQVDYITRWCYVNELEQGEQKPADKVEPKFKVGDWITDGNITIQIEAIKNGCYLYCGDCALYSIKTADKVYHLWTIQDAKDGDILACGDKVTDYPFIFHNLTEDLNPRSYCGVNILGQFQYNDENGGFWCKSDKVRPATREQRDMLIKAMNDAGYTFDFEKKELKKVEQECHCNGVREPREATGVLKQLLNKENSVWSEEDEAGLGDAMWAIEQARTIAKDENDMGNLWYAEHWLKSLKDKYTWKPSEEQMRELYNVFNYTSAGWEDSVIESLYNDLKKLREE